MTTVEKWNKIVDHVNKNRNSLEKDIQDAWEKIFIELLDYSHLDEEVERHRNIRLGSLGRIMPDIIIRDKNVELFVVELKQYNLPFCKDNQLQLI